ncbi:uncharacterized protein LOC123660890 [Melitaea cinxia]|uniref:uncharacterized protein LOC123660890 n=1 Tax=Melitaea cinxia TaxID=113334 RepID=UPI001E272353|nr:uncharacterized protein LOC123660890 [Melitaea cinxia]
MNFKYDLITLFELIEARPCLWNKNSEEFKNKSLREKSWQEIFSSLDDTYEEQSREEKKKTGVIIMSKWANIRDAFMRSLKTKNGQVKKKYLYSEYLQFLLGCQALNEMDSSMCGDEENSMELHERESQSSIHIIDFVDTNSMHDTRKAKRPKRDFDDTEKESLDRSKCKELESMSNSNENFFTSFLPYIYDMTESEKLELHMDILKSIKDIKQNRTQSRFHTQSLTTNQCTSTSHIKPDIT